MKARKYYTIEDYLQARCNLDNIKCKHCDEIGEVVINSKVADGCCQICGKWQLED